MGTLKLNEWVLMDSKEHLGDIIQSLEQTFWSMPFPRMDIAVQELGGFPQRSLLVREATTPTPKAKTISIVCAEDFGESPPALSLWLQFVTPDGGNDELALSWQTESHDPMGDPAHNARFLFTTHAGGTGFSILAHDWIDMANYWAERWTHFTVHA